MPRCIHAARRRENRPSCDSHTRHVKAVLKADFTGGSLHGVQVLNEGLSKYWQGAENCRNLGNRGLGSVADVSAFYRGDSARQYSQEQTKLGGIQTGLNPSEEAEKTDLRSALDEARVHIGGGPQGDLGVWRLRLRDLAVSLRKLGQHIAHFFRRQGC